MPGLGLNRGAADGFAARFQEAVEDFLGEDDPEQDDEGPWAGHGARALVAKKLEDNLVPAVQGDHETGPDDEDRPRDGRERFEFAVAVGMLGVRRLGGNTERAPDQY